MQELQCGPYFSLLPAELTLGIINRLRPEDAVIVRMVGRYFRKLADDNLLWKNFVAEAVPITNLHPIESYKIYYQTLKPAFTKFRMAIHAFDLLEIVSSSLNLYQGHATSDNLIIPGSEKFESMRMMLIHLQQLSENLKLKLQDHSNLQSEFLAANLPFLNLECRNLYSIELWWLAVSIAYPWSSFPWILDDEDVRIAMESGNEATQVVDTFNRLLDLFRSISIPEFVDCNNPKIKFISRLTLETSMRKALELLTQFDMYWSNFLKAIVAEQTKFGKRLIPSHCCQLTVQGLSLDVLYQFKKYRNKRDLFEEKFNKTLEFLNLPGCEQRWMQFRACYHSHQQKHLQRATLGNSFILDYIKYVLHNSTKIYFPQLRHIKIKSSQIQDPR